MALLWMEGFEAYNNGTAVQRRYNGQNVNSMTIETGRIDGRALKNGSPSNSLVVPMTLGDNTMIFGFGQLTEVGVIANDIVRFYTDGTETIVIRTTGGGEIAIDRGATQLGVTSGLGLTGNTWAFIELEILFTDGATGTVDLNVRGQNVLSLTNVQTRAVSGSNPNFIVFEGDLFNELWYDDIYLCDGTGAAPFNAMLGDCHIERIDPDGNGNANDFTATGAASNWQAVDDGNTPDDDSTYNSSSTVADQELYTFSALTGAIDTVYAVKPIALVRKVDTGTRGIELVARSSATEVNQDEQFLDSAYRYIDSIYTADPNGGGAWSESSVNAAEFGIEIAT